ncbi:MAG: RNA pseudouridine synthase [Woeseiaceae bacterium]|nr:RNA pseudouridine synthase [Woeseiaceae bacterium]
MNKPEDRQEFHVSVASTDDNAVSLLHEVSDLSRGRIKSAMGKGAVWITRGRRTRRLRRAKRSLTVGDELHFYYKPEVLDEVPSPPTLVADIGDYSVWNKPYGLRSQGSKWGDHCTVGRWAEQHLQPERPSFVVHRLDRAANGLILVAHTKKTASKLSALFQQRQVEKRYRARVAGDFSSLQMPVRVEEPVDGREAISEFNFLHKADGSSLVDVSIETGRKHQVRRHLASLGFPILGDRLYGDGENDGVDLQLTACLLRFRCPVTGEIVEYRLSEDGGNPAPLCPT